METFISSDNMNIFKILCCDYFICTKCIDGKFDDNYKLDFNYGCFALGLGI